MAVTKGHGNPHWTRDETILALDLYFDCADQLPSSSDQRVHELSELLRAFPHHSHAARKESFRNPDGVSFKLQNIRQVATGKGLGNVSKMDRQVWAELGSEPQRTKQLAALIRKGIEVVESVKEEEAPYEVFTEGRVVTETHLRRERDPKIRKKLLQAKRNAGSLECEICGNYSPVKTPELEESMFEAHHILPLSVTQERKTKLSEMALVCANCHRMIHRAIALRKRWLSIEEAQKILSNQNT